MPNHKNLFNLYVHKTWSSTQVFQSSLSTPYVSVTLIAQDIPPKLMDLKTTVHS